MNRNAVLAFSGGILTLAVAFIISIQFAHAIVPDTSVTAITNSLSPATVVGQSYTVDVNVTDITASSTPLGLVVVTDGGSSCGPVSLDASGDASCSLTSTTAGSKTITASYVSTSPSNFANSDSSGTPVSHTVNAANTTVTITNAASLGSTPTTVNEAYTVNWSVAVNAPGSGTPTGNVTVSDGTDSCNAAVAAGTCDLTSTTNGSKTLTISYAGDANFNASSDHTSSHTVTADVYVDASAGNDANSGTAASPVKTISHAVSITPASGTIHVAAGTYNESVVIDKSLTLDGAQHGVDARSRSAAESIINGSSPIAIEADNVVVDGFTIQGSDSSDKIAGVWTNPSYSGTHGGHQILNNIIQDNVIGIELDNDGTYQTKVQYNLIQNNNNSGPASGTGIIVSFGLKNALIDSNKFVGQTSASLSIQGGATNPVTISNNALDAGIGLFSSSGVSITGNSASSPTNPAVDIGGGDSSISISGNTFTGGTGVLVENPYSIGANSGVTVNSNDLSGNTQGVKIDAPASYTGGSLDASQDWWGDATGPTNADNSTGTGSGVSGDVVFRPWCINVGCSPIDTTAPTVSSVSVSPNPAKAGTATVTVTFGESTMNNGISPTVTVSGTFGGPFTVTQTSYSGATWTGTVTIPNHNEENTATVNISGSEDTSGNQQVGTDSSYTFLVDTEVPTISSITSVDSGVGSTLKIGDAITFTLTPGKTEASATISGSYNGRTLSWSTADAGATYTATYTVTAGDTDRASPLQITGVTITDAAGNVSASAGGSDVSKGIDANVPTLTGVHIQSNNAHSAHAKTGNTVTLTFTSSEAVRTPTVSIAGHAASVSGGPTNWTASYTFAGTETEGAVLFTADFSDLAGNAGTQVAATTDLSSVTFDKTAPSIDTHADIFSVEATGHAGAVVNYTTPTAHDVIDGAFVADCAPASGSIFRLGTTTVTCNASDAAGNAASPITFNVGVVDTTAPNITQSNIYSVEATSSSGASVRFSPVGTDNYDLSVTVNCTPASSSLFAIGTTTVNCSATDSNNNTGHRSFDIGVVDTTPPVITLTGDATTTVGLNNAYVEPGYSANDAVDGTTTVTVTGTVNTATEGTYALTYSSSDSHGNSSSKTRHVVVSSTTLAVATSTVGSSVVGTLTNPTDESFSSAWTKLEIQTPANLTITGPVGWDGTLELPHQATSYTAPTNADVQNQVEIGFPNTLLTFNKGVRILLKDMAPSHVGYSRSGVFTEITAICASDSQATGDALPAGGDCRINVGNNAVIWTKHFTTFIGYVPLATTSSGSGGGGGNGPVSSGGGGGGGSSAPVTTPTTPAPTAPTGQVLGASTFNFTTDLRVGSRGEAVTELQKILIAEGFLTGQPTGYFGGQTRAALVHYQKAHGISPASGIAGPKTRSELNKGSNPTSTDEDKAKKIQSLQEILQALLAKIAALKANGQ